MKNGIVTNGRTTTYYGTEATLALARMSLQFSTKEETEEKILKATGPYQEALAYVADKIGHTVSPELRAKIEEAQAKYKKEQEELRIASLKKWFSEKPVKVAKRLLSKNCSLCKQPIAHLQGYHDRVHQKAHAVCVANPRSEA